MSYLLEKVKSGTCCDRVFAECVLVFQIFCYDSIQSEIRGLQGPLWDVLFDVDILERGYRLLPVKLIIFIITASIFYFCQLPSSPGGMV
jgi:hypothetical protein